MENCIGSHFFSTHRKKHPNRCPLTRSALDFNRAFVVIDNFLYDRHAESRAVFLAVSEEGLEYFAAYAIGDAFAGVDKFQDKPIFTFEDIDGEGSAVSHRVDGVAADIVK